MLRLLGAFAFAALLAGSAAASDKTDVMTVVHQYIDALNKGDMKAAAAICADQGSIIDDTPPYEWHGKDVCAQYSDALAKISELYQWSHHAR